LILDTASRDELGTGKNVLKGTLIRAWFLENGAIFADIAMHVMDDTQLGKNPLTVYDDYRSYDGTPNDMPLGTLLHAKRTPSNAMQGAYDRAIEAERARRLKKRSQ
jgi:hypothetical protein